MEGIVAGVSQPCVDVVLNVLVYHIINGLLPMLFHVAGAVPLPDVKLSFHILIDFIEQLCGLELLVLNQSVDANVKLQIEDGVLHKTENKDGCQLDEHHQRKEVDLVISVRIQFKVGHHVPIADSSSRGCDEVDKLTVLGE